MRENLLQVTEAESFATTAAEELKDKLRIRQARPEGGRRINSAAAPDDSTAVDGSEGLRLNDREEEQWQSQASHRRWKGLPLR